MDRKYAARAAGAVLSFLVCRVLAYFFSAAVESLPALAHTSASVSTLVSAFSAALAAILAAALCFGLSRFGICRVSSPGDGFGEGAEERELSLPCSGSGKRTVAASHVAACKRTSAASRTAVFAAVCASLALLLTFDAALALLIPAEAPPLTVTDAAVSMTVYPLSEEFLYRGAMMYLLLPPEYGKDRRCAVCAVAVESLLFAAAHPLPSVPTAALAGAVFGALSLMTGKGGAMRKFPAVAAAAHILYNGVVCLTRVLPGKLGMDGRFASPVIAFAAAAVFAAAAMLICAKIKKES